MIRHYNKLVRDKVLRLLLKEGYTYESDTYKGHFSYRKALVDKLNEDLTTFLDTGIRENQIEKLADALEIVYVLASDCDIKKNVLEEARVEKKKLKGSYKDRIKLISVDDHEDI